MGKIRSIWDSFVASILSYGNDKMLHFMFGALVASFASITLHMSWYSILPTIVVGLGKEIFDFITTKNFDWRDLLATTLGGALVESFIAMGKLHWIWSL